MNNLEDLRKEADNKLSIEEAVEVIKEKDKIKEKTDSLIEAIHHNSNIFCAEALRPYFFRLSEIIENYIKKGYDIEVISARTGYLMDKKSFKPYIVIAKPYTIDLEDSKCLDDIITDKKNQKLVIYMLIPKSSLDAQLKDKPFDVTLWADVIDSTTESF